MSKMIQQSIGSYLTYRVVGNTIRRRAPAEEKSFFIAFFILVTPNQFSFGSVLNYSEMIRTTEEMNLAVVIHR